MAQIMEGQTCDPGFLCPCCPCVQQVCFRHVRSTTRLIAQIVSWLEMHGFFGRHMNPFACPGIPPRPVPAYWSLFLNVISPATNARICAMVNTNHSKRITDMNKDQHLKIQRRGSPALRLVIALLGVAILSGCIVAPGGYGYGYRVHPLIHPGWGRGWRR